jgi:hypothetical protein
MPISVPIMLRKLLTLLALCAGLVAVGEPARAAVDTVESVHLVEQAGQACAARTSFQSPVADQRQHWRELLCQGSPKPVSLAIVPTVRLQVDRSRE